MNKIILTTIFMLSIITAKAQLLPLTQQEQVRLKALDSIWENNRKLEVLYAVIKRIQKENGKIYAFVEWENLGKQTITSFSGKQIILTREIDDEAIFFDAVPLSMPLQPKQTQIQQYEIKGKFFTKEKLPVNDPIEKSIFLTFRPDIITTDKEIIARKKFAKDDRAELTALIDRNKDYNIYKEITERKQRFLENEAKLKLLEGRFIKIDLIDGKPVVSCSFTNKSKQKLHAYNITIKVWQGDNKNNGWSLSDGNNDDLLPGASIIKIVRIRNIDMSKMKFPVTDLAQYNLQIESKCDMIIIGDEKYFTIDYDNRDEESLRILKERYNIK